MGGRRGGRLAAYEELLAGQLRVLGPEHADTLAIRHNLAYWRGQAATGGDPAGAAAYEGLLADQLRVLGSDHPDILTTRTTSFIGGEAEYQAGKLRPRSEQANRAAV